MTKPFFTAEDFECDCPTEKSDKSAYEHLLKKDARKGHYDWCRACDGAWDANAKVAPLIAENRRLQEQLTEASGEVERLRDENRKILKELNATTQGRENAYKEQEKLTEQNRIMKEALEFYSGTVEKQVEIWDKSLLIDRGDKARETLAKCKEFEK